jgi:hypothetical protein
MKNVKQVMLKKKTNESETLSDTTIQSLSMVDIEQTSSNLLDRDYNLCLQLV